MFQPSSVSLSTQTQEETLPSKLYSWFKKGIIDDRIKKRWSSMNKFYFQSL